MSTTTHSLVNRVRYTVVMPEVDLIVHLSGKFQKQPEIHKIIFG